MSLSLSAATFTLLFSAAVFAPDTGQELAQLDAPQVAASDVFDFTALEIDPAAAVCRPDTEPTQQPVQDDPELSSQSECAPPQEPEIQVASSFSCVAYSWGWKCFYPDRYCYFFYTGGVYCYRYADQNGW